MLPRRTLLSSLALPVLAGCAAPIPRPMAGATSSAARDVLQASAEAHGVAALKRVSDIAVSYAGQWRPLVGHLQPVLVDAGHRSGSQERLLLAERLVAQSHTGPAGYKQVVRHAAAGSPGTVRVWFDGQESRDRDPLHAAALVADGYSLFLLGPMLLAGAWAAERAPAMDLAERERIAQDTGLHECDVLRVRLAPGLGLSDADTLVLYIDTGTRLMCRVRLTLDGLDGTRGAVAEVDTLDHVPYAGVQWPTRFHEQLLRPVPLPVHDWRLTGLDVNRGLQADMVTGSAFTGRAADPAAAWTTG